MSTLKSVAELEDDLKSARDALEKQRRDSLLKEFTDALEGKFFLSIWTYRGGRGL